MPPGPVGAACSAAGGRGGSLGQRVVFTHVLAQLQLGDAYVLCEALQLPDGLHGVGKVVQWRGQQQPWASSQVLPDGEGRSGPPGPLCLKVDVAGPGGSDVTCSVVALGWRATACRFFVGARVWVVLHVPRSVVWEVGTPGSAGDP